MQGVESVTETGVVGGELSLSSSSSSRMGFPAEPPISKSSNVVNKNAVSVPVLKTASTSKWSFSQWNSKASRSYTLYPLVSISCAPTLESNSSFISIVPSWLGVIGTRARWLFKESCLGDSKKLQAARGTSWEFTVISWTRSLTVTETESGTKSRDSSIRSLETEKTMLLYCRLKVYKMRMQLNF